MGWRVRCADWRLWVMAGGVIILLSTAATVWAAQAQPQLEARAAQAIARGLGFLAAAQQPSGHFLILRWNKADVADAPIEQISPFATAHIAAALRAVRNEAARTLENRALDALSSEQMNDGLCKFLSRADPASERLPADVEDTAFCAGLLASAGRAEKITPDFARYRDGAGRFVTWVFPAVAPTKEEIAFYSGPPLYYEQRLPNEVDCVVNANTLFGMALLGQKLPAEPCEYVGAVISGEKFPGCSLYYRDESVFAYAAARASEAGAGCVTPHISALASRLASSQNKDGGWGSALNTALAASALLSINGPGARSRLDQAIAWLLGHQAQDGGWPADAYFIENLNPNIVFGSRSITTATALEAVSRYLSAMKASP